MKFFSKEKEMKQIEQTKIALVALFLIVSVGAGNSFAHPIAEEFMGMEIDRPTSLIKLPVERDDSKNDKSFVVSLEPRVVGKTAIEKFTELLASLGHYWYPVL